MSLFPGLYDHPLQRNSLKKLIFRKTADFGHFGQFRPFPVAEPGRNFQKAHRWQTDGRTPRIYRPQPFGLGPKKKVYTRIQDRATLSPGPRTVTLYSNHPNRTLYPKRVACIHARGQCTFGMSTVTVYFPGYRKFQKNMEYFFKIKIKYDTKIPVYLTILSLINFRIFMSITLNKINGNAKRSVLVLVVIILDSTFLSHCNFSILYFVNTSLDAPLGQVLVQQAQRHFESQIHFHPSQDL